MRYIENFDPGFQELTTADFEPDTAEVKELKQKTLLLIESEYTRLKLKQSQKDFLPYQFGIGKPETNSALNLKMYLDWLQTLNCT